MTKRYEVYKKLKRPPYGVGVYGVVFSRKEDAEKFAERVDGWVEEVLMEEEKLKT